MNDFKPFKMENLGSCRVINSRSKYRPNYISQYICLDTETSHNHDENDPIGWIYQWCLSYNNKLSWGRTPTQLFSVLRWFRDIYHLHENKNMVVYVHNLSYDATYLLQYMRQELGEQPRVLSLKPHKILTISCGGFEFRCSYLLSNMSLEQWSNKLNTSYKKKSGFVDYDIIRYQDTPLTCKDWLYMAMDVLTLDECIKTTMINDKFNVSTIPLTSTGFVRLDCRNATRKMKKYRDWFKTTRLKNHSYTMARRSFMGGYTHGNRWHLNETINARVSHFDFKSEYPSVWQLCDFPIGQPILYYSYDVTRLLPLQEYEEQCLKNCALADLYLYNARLKRGVTAPYLSKSKCIGEYRPLLDDMKTVGTDNGRIINFEGVARFTCTEIDFFILMNQYEFDKIVVGDMYIMKRGRIQECLLSQIDKYFFIKENAPEGYERMKSKNKLNAIYGMSASDIVRQELVYDDTTGEFVPETDVDVDKKLDKYYNSRNNFMNYLFGLYTTAHARKWLIIDVIQNIIGYDKFLYCDTDSAFFFYDEKVIEKINSYNKNIIELNKSLGKGVTNKKGTMSYYGTFEDEHDNIIKFRYLHSKCYAFVDDKNKLHCTIAGVNKYSKVNHISNADELKTIDNLKDDFTFVKCGGTRSIYPPVRQPEIIEIDGHITELSSSCVIVPTTKQISTIFDFGIFTEGGLYD